MAARAEQGQSVQPLVLVQGFANYDYAVRPMRQEFRKAGIHAVHSHAGLISSTMLPWKIYREVRKVDKQVTHEIDKYGTTDILGFSWGGPIAELMAIRHPEVKRVFTVGSPPKEAALEAIDMFDFPFTRPLASAIRYGLTEFLDELNEGEIPPTTMQVHLWSRDDGVVSHQPCPNDKATHYEVHGQHLELLNAREVTSTVSRIEKQRTTLFEYAKVA